jgi:hypothetical protein
MSGSSSPQKGNIRPLSEGESATSKSALKKHSQNDTNKERAKVKDALLGQSRSKQTKKKKRVSDDELVSVSRINFYSLAVLSHKSLKTNSISWLLLSAIIKAVTGQSSVKYSTEL